MINETEILNLDDRKLVSAVTQADKGDKNGEQKYKMERGMGDITTHKSNTNK
jgi:hypothetical protein